MKVGNPNDSTFKFSNLRLTKLELKLIKLDYMMRDISSLSIKDCITIFGCYFIHSSRRRRKKENTKSVSAPTVIIINSIQRNMRFIKYNKQTAFDSLKLDE